jgi:hypothetical protein
VWEVETFKGPSSEEITLFISVNEIQESDSQEEQRSKTFEDLENILSRKKSEAQEEERQWSLDHSAKDQQPSDSRQGA